MYVSEGSSNPLIKKIYLIGGPKSDHELPALAYSAQDHFAKHLISAGPSTAHFGNVTETEVKSAWHPVKCQVRLCARQTHETQQWKQGLM